MVTARYWVLGTSFALSVLAVPLVFASDATADDSVVVIRGSQVQVQGSSSKPAKTKKQAAKSTQPEADVAVLRPAPGSFMRETTKLAAEAQAREEQAAREAAREMNTQVAEALQAVTEAAAAAQAQPRTTRHWVRMPPVRTGTIDPKTGKFYPAVRGGVIDPETGRFIPTP